MKVDYQHLPKMRSYEARTASECGLISHGLPRGAHNRAITMHNKN
jgi:hypothetical protein